MSRLELLAGDFGTGTARYEKGEFRLPHGKLQYAGNIVGIEANTTVIEKHWGRAIMDGARNAVGLAPVAMLVGLFAAPALAIGTVGIAAAAIGGALGLLGGGAETKALVQITFEQGTALVAVCELELVEAIRSDAALMRAHAERERRRLEPPKRGWFSGWSTTPEPEPAPLPPPPAALPPPDEQNPSSFIDTASEHISAATAATTAVASSAVDATGQALSGAFAFAKRAAGLDKK